MKPTNVRYFIFVLFGVAILGTVIFSYNQFSLFQEEKTEVEKTHHKEIIEAEISIKETKLNLLGLSLVSFYENSDTVTTDEYNQYVKKMLQEIPEIKNIFYLQNNEIVQSYPHTEFVDSEFDSMFPSYPITMDGIKLMTLDYVIDENQKIVISAPFDFILNAEPILGDDFKLILYSPLNSKLIYESGFKNGIKITEPIELTPEELDSSIIIQKQTDLFGNKIKQHYVLDYIIWSQKFERNVDVFTQFAFIGGIIFAIVVPLLLIRTEQYRAKAHAHAKTVEKVNTQLKEIDKQKGEFSSMVAHELKTPLVPILGNTDFLKNPKMIEKLDSMQLEAVNSIENNAKILETLISDLLDVQKIHLQKMKFTKSTFDVMDFMNSVKTNWDHYMKEKQIEFVNTTKESFDIVSDEGRLRQVLGNLVKNAVDFVPEKGRIEIDATFSNNNVVFYVKDNGIGITKEEQDQLFKKFYQADTSVRRKHGGTGLGLVICKGIVEGLGGTIWFRSKEGQGTTFYFSIPLEGQKVQVRS